MRTAKATDAETVEQAVAVLRDGGVVAYPTETTYGLGCDPRNREALDKIYRIKNRPADKALPLVADTFAQVEQYFLIPEAARKLAEKYWPGPLSILLEPRPEHRKDFEQILRDGLAAVRVSSNEFVRRLSSSYGFPLCATSANKSGERACLLAQEVADAFGGNPVDEQPDLIVDGGVLAPSKPSTIVKINDDGLMEIVRQGSVSLFDKMDQES